MQKIGDRDNNLAKIKDEVILILPDSRVILFGSRGNGTFDARSDYDILIISKTPLDVKTKRQYQGRIRKKLACLGIPADVLVKTETDVSYFKDKIGSILRTAVTEGVAL